MSEPSSVPNYPSPCPAPATPDLREAIRRRAEQIYIQGGSIPGRDLENWAKAEQEIRHQAEQAMRHPAVVVKVNGVQYVGEYRPETSEGYLPGELGSGTSVPVRFDGNKMFVKRPNGKELETVIVKKIG